MEAFGVPRQIVAFVLPTGYSFNMDGSTLYLALASIFVAQAAGIHLTFGQQLLMVFTLMLTSKGVAGIPRTAWALIGLTLVLHAWNLGAPELTDTDESRSGCIVRDMVEGGHWLLPRTPDGILCEKPPVYYASSAVLVKLLGRRSEAALRVLSLAMAGVALVATAWLAGLYGSPRASWIAVVALASNLIFIRWARQAMVDMTFATFLTAGFAAYFAARLGRLRPRTAAIACGISFALAVLTKGPLGLALPIAVIGGDALVTSRGKFWKLPIPWGWGALGFALAVAIPLAWYLPAYKAGGYEFLKTCVITENFKMPVGDAEGTGVSHQKKWYHFYYFWNQLLWLVPMLPLLPEWVRWLAARGSGPARAQLASWAGFGFLLFLISAAKRHYYLLPLQPAFAIMIALATDQALREGRSRFLLWGGAVSGALVILVCSGGLYGALNASRLPGRLAPNVVEAIGHHSIRIAFASVVGIVAGAWMLAAFRREGEPVVRATAFVAFFIIAANAIVADTVIAELNPNRRFVAPLLTRSWMRDPAVMPPFPTYGLHYYWPGKLPQSEEAAAKSPVVFVRRDSLGKIRGPYEVLSARSYGSSEKDVLVVRRK